MTKIIVSEAMVEAGARAINRHAFSDAFTLSGSLAIPRAQRDARDKARACLEAALAVK